MANTCTTQVGAPEEVRVTVDGEALIDDGVAYVLYAVFLVRCRLTGFLTTSLLMCQKEHLACSTTYSWSLLAANNHAALISGVLPLAGAPNTGTDKWI